MKIIHSEGGGGENQKIYILHFWLTSGSALQKIKFCAAEYNKQCCAISKTGTTFF